MAVTVPQLRANIYELIDQVIETGEPLEIDRNGVVVRLMPPVRQSWLDRLPRRDVVAGDADDLPDIHWSGEWTPDG